MAKHDQAYKLLFSHPQMVRDLLEGFVREDWIAELDFGSLEKVNSRYVSDDLRKRSNDVVWRVRWGTEWVYVYVLLEFQSRAERYMAVRIQNYVSLLYQDLIRTKQLGAGGKLPPVLPIVLYNGARRWRSPVVLEELIQRGPRALAAYQPQMRFLLIDEGRYRDSELEPLRNLVAALVRLENSRTPADVLRIVSSLAEWLKATEQASLRRAFVVWINRVILAPKPGGPIVGVEELEEMSTADSLGAVFVDQLADLYEPDEARLWLFSRQKLLHGARPADLIQQGRTDEVLQMLRQLLEGVHA